MASYQAPREWEEWSNWLAGLTPFPSRGWCVELVEFMETRFFSRRFTYVIRLRGELVGLLAASL